MGEGGRAVFPYFADFAVLRSSAFYQTVRHAGKRSSRSREIYRWWRLVFEQCKRIPVRSRISIAVWLWIFSNGDAVVYVVCGGEKKNCISRQLDI